MRVFSRSTGQHSPPVAPVQSRGMIAGYFWIARNRRIPETERLAIIVAYVIHFRTVCRRIGVAKSPQSLGAAASRRLTPQSFLSPRSARGVSPSTVAGGWGGKELADRYPVARELVRPGISAWRALHETGGLRRPAVIAAGIGTAMRPVAPRRGRCGSPTPGPGCRSRCYRRTPPRHTKAPSLQCAQCRSLATARQKPVGVIEHSTLAVVLLPARLFSSTGTISSAAAGRNSAP